MMSYRRKTKQKRIMQSAVYFHAEKNGMCTGKINCQKSKYTYEI